MKGYPRPIMKTLYVLVPLGYLTCALLFDKHEPFRTVSPPLLSVGLLSFSLFLSPQMMSLWALIYTLVVGKILLNPLIYAYFSNGQSIPDLPSHRFRVLGFVVTAAFACAFSWMLGGSGQRGKCWII